MIITVKIIKGKECTIEASASSSVSTVKQLVAEELQIPVEQQRLVFKGKTLSDSSCLCDYDIVDGNRLHLFVRKKGENYYCETNVLWDHLQKFLEKHFTPTDAKKVFEEFHKNFYASFSKLSLDDIERLATSNLEAEFT
ncbi:ubiquitin-like protein 4A [Centruroides vittatus]|uniref:ubiquitin-like protein 4A n=1 Tax=Centruroides vittatus TaxID=120091 RepID=UPI0035109857